MKNYIHYEGFGIKYVCLLVIILAIFNGCKKNTKEEEPAPAYNLSKAENKKNNKSNSDVPVEWYNLQLRIILNAHPAYSNPVTIRLFSYSGLTLYESVHNMIENAPSLNKIIYQFPSLPQIEESKKYTWPESANTAMAYITRNMFPVLTDQNKYWIDSLEQYFDSTLRNNSNPPEFNRSQSYGKSVGMAIYEWSKSDKFDQANAPYIPPVFPGAWVPTPPAFANAAAPYLGNVRTFLQIHSTGITPPPPFPYSEDPSSDFYKMVKDLYDVSKVLTTDQRNMALYWNDVGAGVGYTPSGHAISILLQIIKNEHIGLGKTAQLFAKTAIGMWDGTIMCWRSKYAYNQLRPVTYIKKVIDNTWMPLLITPPHPEYPAAHAFITSSTMAAATGAIGNFHTITDHTYDFLGYSPRTYTSLLSIGIESGMSRRYGGIHYQPSIDTGVDAGQKAGFDAAIIYLGEEENDKSDQY